MQPDFDPFTATFEEAQAASEWPPTGPCGPWMQFFAAREVDACRADVDKGDGFAVMRAVAVCARQGLRLPDWLVDAFLTRFRAVAHLRVGSWDEAFGVPFPRGTQLAAKRRRFEARARVANVLTEFVQRHPELSVDDVYAAASAKVRDRGTGPVAEYAGRLGVGRTEAQRLYAEAINLGMAYPFDEIRKKNGWSARPAKSRKVAGVRRKP